MVAHKVNMAKEIAIFVFTKKCARDVWKSHVNGSHAYTYTSKSRRKKNNLSAPKKRPKTNFNGCAFDCKMICGIRKCILSLMDFIIFIFVCCSGWLKENWWHNRDIAALRIMSYFNFDTMQSCELQYFNSKFVWIVRLWLRFLYN